MTDFQLERFCERNPDCGRICMKCPAFIANMRYNEGYSDDDDDDDEYVD